MIPDLFCWLTSLAFAAAISTSVYGNRSPLIVLCFGLLVYGALIWEHGFKLYYFKKRKIAFWIFYAIPFLACFLFFLNAAAQGIIR